MKVTYGEKRRRREAIETLVNDFIHNESSDVSTMIRDSIEARLFKYYFVTSLITLLLV